MKLKRELMIVIEKTGAVLSDIKWLCLVAVLKRSCVIHFHFIASPLRIPAF
jgi:hypothetical protein